MSPNLSHILLLTEDLLLLSISLPQVSHHVSMCLDVGRDSRQDSRGLGSLLPVGARATSSPQVPGSKPLCEDRTVGDP